MEKATEPRVSVRTLAVNKKTIPVYFKSGDYWNTNIKLPDIVIVNHAAQTVVVKEMEISGFARGKKVASFRIYEDEIKDVIADGNSLLNRLTKEPINNWKRYSLGMIFGDIPIMDKTYAVTNRLLACEMTCVRLSSLLYFHYIGREKIDQISCQVVIDLGAEQELCEYPVTLTPYVCRGDYIFPVRGSVTVLGLPWNLVEGHRMATSQEFAFDVVDFRRLENGELLLSSPPKSDKVSDYFAFEREVLAIGDGCVVKAGNRWPNKWAENPQEYSEKRVTELTLQLLQDGLEFDHAILGNYVVLDHQNGEYSLYAHMSENSVTVKVGDLVKQGQVIGKIGNTSNSTAPHLHFHLMDSQEFQLANGLPVMFKDLAGPQAPVYDFEASNSLLYSDYIFAYLSE